jgi:hypothetical protein
MNPTSTYARPGRPRKVDIVAAAYRWRMAANPKPEPPANSGAPRVAPHEPGRQPAPEMSERLARLHELCKQMTAIAGAARRT